MQEKLDACAAQGADQCVNYGAEPDYEAFIATLREADMYLLRGTIVHSFDPQLRGKWEIDYILIFRGAGMANTQLCLILSAAHTVRFSIDFATVFALFCD